MVFLVEAAADLLAYLLTLIMELDGVKHFLEVVEVLVDTVTLMLKLFLEHIILQSAVVEQVVQMVEVQVREIHQLVLD
jgi:hypothetical protein